MDAIHLKIRRDDKVQNTAVYIVLGVDLEGQRDVLGQWEGSGAEGANFWLSVVSDLQARGVQDILRACSDGLSGFKEAIQTVFPHTQIQRCLIHQVRQSLTYVSWKDRKAFTADLKTVYQAPTREAAEMRLLSLAERWGERYPMAVRSWENAWDDLATMFEYPSEIRRLIYTTNSIEGYNRQLRKVTKTKGAFPTDQAVRKLLFLVNRDITRKWTMPVPNWARIRNQLAIRFVGRFPISFHEGNQLHKPLDKLSPAASWANPPSGKLNVQRTCPTRFKMFIAALWSLSRDNPHTQSNQRSAHVCSTKTRPH